MKRTLKEGDVIEITHEHTVYADIPEHFAYANRSGVFDKTAHTDVRIKDAPWLAGTYVVTSTSRDGGGMASDGAFPDGHHVWCRRKDGVRVDFYQSGCFTAMIEDISPTGRATMDWVIEDQS